MDYDKTKDPYRVSESVVRAELKAINESGCWPAGFHLVQQGAFTPGGEGCYASVRVVCLADDMSGDTPFSTHDAVLKADGDDDRSVYLIAGLYDLTVEKAAAAL